MLLRSFALLLALALVTMAFTNSRHQVADSTFCGIRNTSFKEEERITYTVYYTVIGLYINAGTAVFTTKLERLNGKPVYHVVGTGVTHPSYDWVYRVRDRYESYIDTNTMQPLRFVRNVDEGGYKIYHLDYLKIHFTKVYIFIDFSKIRI